MATNGGSTGAAVHAAPVDVAGVWAAFPAVLDDGLPSDLLLVDAPETDPARFLSEWDLADAFPELVTDALDTVDAVDAADDLDAAHAVEVPAVPAGDAADAAPTLDTAPTPGAGLVLRQGCLPPTGPALAAAMAAVDLDDCDDHEVIEAIAQWERLVTWAAERSLAAVAELARRPLGIQLARAGGEPGEQDLAAMRAARAPAGTVVREPAGNEIAARLNISRRSADAKITLGTALAARLPAIRAALADGRVDLTRARVVSDRTGVLDDDQAREVDRQVAGPAADSTPAQLRRTVDRAVHCVDAAAAARRAARARADRCVTLTPLPDGVGELVANLPAADAVAIDTVINAAAAAMHSSRAPDDERSMDQLRADALAAPFLHALSTGELAGVVPVRLARRRGRRAAIQLTVPATTLLGVGHDPGELAGYGVVDAETARAVAADPDSTWRRILTEPASGAVLDVGTRLYRPPAALARHVEVRDARCVAPGCSVPADRCDLDHTVPFPDGPTAAHNLQARCRRDHRWKQSAGVRVVQRADGSSTWTTASGHVYDVPPRQVGPVPARPAHEPAHEPVPDPAHEPVAEAVPAPVQRPGPDAGPAPPDTS